MISEVFFCFVFKFFYIYLFLRERESASRGGAERERGRNRIWSRLQALSCQHRARCGAWSHGLCDHDLSWSWTLNRLSHPGAPLDSILDQNRASIASSFKSFDWRELCGWPVCSGQDYMAAMTFNYKPTLSLDVSSFASSSRHMAYYTLDKEEQMNE